MERRVSEHDGILQEHSRSIGRLQGQFGIIVGLQVAQISGVVAILIKVFGG